MVMVGVDSLTMWGGVSTARRSGPVSIGLVLSPFAPRTDEFAAAAGLCSFRRSPHC